MSSGFLSELSNLYDAVDQKSTSTPKKTKSPIKASKIFRQLNIKARNGGLYSSRKGAQTKF